MNIDNLTTENWNNHETFTAFALNELDESQENKFKKKLLSLGLSENEIDEEREKLRDIQERLTTEFQKDQNLRVSPEVRDKINEAAHSGPFRLLRNWWVPTTAVGVLCFSVFMINDEKNDVNNFDLPDQNTPSTQNELILEEAEKIAPPIKKTIKKHNISVKRKGFPKAKKMARGGEQEIAMSLSNFGDSMVTNSSFVPLQDKAEKFNREAYDKIDVNEYKLVSQAPLSTFSIDVDTASYANMRRFLFNGNMPPKDSIRVEEVINYFPYDYRFKNKGHPLAVKVSQVESPWNKKRKVVRIALKADTPRDLVKASKNLVFLMDVSGSMRDAKKLPLLKESLKLLLRKLKKNDTVALVVYAGAAGIVLEPTPVSERIKILKALDNLNAGGSTNGGAGIKAAYKMAKLGFIKNGVNRVILATDGDFNVGASSQSALIDMVEEKAKENIFLTVIGLGMGNYQDSMLEKISNRGNGNYAYIDSLNEANKLFNIDLEKNLTTVAKDVKVQVEFNPNLVEGYRLVGYENRMLAAQDFNDDKKDAGEMGAGHTVTALYEIALKGEKLNLPKIDKLKYGKKVKNLNKFGEELLTVKVRYKHPTENKSKKFEEVLKSRDVKLKNADGDFRWAIAASSLALKLRGDKFTKELRYREIKEMAKGSKGQDEYGLREEFIDMIDYAMSIDK